MMRKQYTIVVEPKGVEYCALLYALSQISRQVLLVVRHEIPLSAFGKETLWELEKDLIAREERQEWPGTKLYEGSATIYLFNLTKHCLDILCTRAYRLYQWRQPRLPEDLCFMRNEIEPVLVSISHECDAYLLLSDDEKQKLLSAVPTLHLRTDKINFFSQ